MNGVVLREIGFKVVGVAPKYRFAVYPSAFSFWEGHYIGEAFRWVVDAESVVIDLGPCVCGLSCGGESRVYAGEEVCMYASGRGGAMFIWAGWCCVGGGGILVFRR